MSHSHLHLDAPVEAGSRPLQKAYGVAIALNFAFVILEFVIGRTSHSLGLVSDAGHKLLDVLMLVLALVGFHLARRPATDARRISACRTFAPAR